jgi:hypothetical protein
MNETTAVFETSCPYGYVVPSDPTKKSIMWLPGTVTGALAVYFISRHMIHFLFHFILIQGCAVSCPQPFYTPAQNYTQLHLLETMAYLAFVALAFLFTNVILTSSAKRNYYLVVVGIIDLLFYAAQINNVRSTWASPLKGGFLDVLPTACDTNASWSDSHENAVCNFEGVILYFFTWGNFYV